MPDYLLVGSVLGGWAIGVGATDYYAPRAGYHPDATEVQAQVLARDSYTLKNLYVRIISNARGAVSTAKSRIDGGDGNQSVSIPDDGTGAFEDAVNTDALVSGTLFCGELDAPGGSGSLTFSAWSFIISTVSNTTPILVTSQRAYIGESGTRYTQLVGRLYENGSQEVATKYKFRVAATLSNLRVYIYSNQCDLSASTVRTRVNGANGNQSVSIPAGTGGSFEDAVFTDNISINDDVNYQIIAGSASEVEDLVPSVIQLKSDSDGNQIAAVTQSPAGVGINFGATVYTAIEGLSSSTYTTESDYQVKARIAFRAANMYVEVYANSINGNTVLTLRKNGAGTALTITVGSTATGQFEDTTHAVDFVPTDLLSWQIAAAGSSGSMSLNAVGFEQQQERPAVGLENKSANMGSKMVAAGLI